MAVDLNFENIQGNTLQAYRRHPFAEYLLLKVTEAEGARQWLRNLLPGITNAVQFVNPDDQSYTTTNVAFTYPGLEALELDPALLGRLSRAFHAGMRGRAEILGDTGANAPRHWEEWWREREVHIWVGLNARTVEDQGDHKGLNTHVNEIITAVEASGSGLEVIARESVARIDTLDLPDDDFPNIEHFGFSDGHGQPSVEGLPRQNLKRRGKLVEDKWVPLRPGEFLFGYASEGDDMVPQPRPEDAVGYPDPETNPHYRAFLNFMSDGTYMVYRKLEQDVPAFRLLIAEHATKGRSTEEVAASFVGRWRDGTPLALAPTYASKTAEMREPEQINEFRYAGGGLEDPAGLRCPIGAHVRRANPRDAFGYSTPDPGTKKTQETALVKHRRIIRRGMPYGADLYIPWDTAEDQLREIQANEPDEKPRGLIFMALNTSIGGQFEVVLGSWLNHGDVLQLGSDKDPLTGNNDGTAASKFVKGGAPPEVITGLPSFVRNRGGDYFLKPGIAALETISRARVGVNVVQAQPVTTR